ncbi:TetR family transcriptional regulator [Streptomyces sp. DG1A-41]|uniref:TetR family transcriptional regulator n=1 Tax=Streptomyces sp. DG1A-41 TaxID=3125779 RepID=UPI0030D151AE
MTDSAGTPARPAAKPGLRERMRATVHAEVVDVALRLFIEQGFDRTTVDQIAAESGLSRASLFRYFGTKEDMVLVGLEGTGRQIAEALAARPDDERPWEALRREGGDAVPQVTPLHVHGRRRGRNLMLWTSPSTSHSPSSSRPCRSGRAGGTK